MLPAGAQAQTESRLSADASVTAGYANNPFSVVGADTSAGVVTIDIAPRYTLLTPRSDLTVLLDGSFQEYLRRYGNNDSFLGSINYTNRSSERLTTHVGLQASSAVLGSNSYLPSAVTVGLPAIGTDAASAGAGTGQTTGTTSPTPVTTIPTTVSPLTQFGDVGLFGSRSRRTLGRATGDVALTLSTRDSLSASGYGELSRYSNLTTGDYQAVGGTLGYSRRLSSRLVVGLSGSGSSYMYRSGFGDSRNYTIQATGSAQLTQRWSADGGIGVSFVDSDTAASTRSTSLSGNLNLCGRYPLSTLCLALARQVSPTGLAGTQYVSSASASYTRQLNEYQNLSLGASYSKVGNGNQLVVGALPLENEYLQASARYGRRLGRRLGLTASAYYRNLLGDTARRPDDFGGQLGLSYRLGDQR